MGARIHLKIFISIVCFYILRYQTESLLILLEVVSDSFWQFLNIIGEEIELKGWKKFRGDFSNHLTDSLKTYYTEWNGIESMSELVSELV
jgi:hypothetical protein